MITVNDLVRVVTLCSDCASLATTRALLGGVYRVTEVDKSRDCVTVLTPDQQEFYFSHTELEIVYTN